MSWLVGIAAAITAAAAWLFRAWRKALTRADEEARRRENSDRQAAVTQKVSVERAKLDAERRAAIAEATALRDEAHREALRAEAATGRLEAAGTDLDRLVEEANRRQAERRKK